MGIKRGSERILSIFLIFFFIENYFLRRSYDSMGMADADLGAMIF